jgi:hypothetical protein
MGLAENWDEMDFIRTISSKAADQFSCILDFASNLLPRASFGYDRLQYRQLLAECLQMLLTAENDIDQQSELWECMSLLGPDWLPAAVPKLIEFLHHNGANGLTKGRIDVTIMLLLIRASKRGENESADVVDALSILVGFSPDINIKFYNGLTLSMYARLSNVWQEWDEALERNGKRLEDVVEKEGNSWLLNEDWSRLWKERGYEHYGELDSDSEDGSDDGESDWSESNDDLVEDEEDAVNDAINGDGLDEEDEDGD